VPLPLPTLDRRTWNELVSEGRSVIPRYAPGWTDHNAHDPGITLMELLAWISELLMFRADRIPAAELRAFLRWLGIAPLPPQAAEAVLALELAAGDPATPLPGGLVVADDVSGLVFEADDALTVSPAWLELDPSEGTARGRICRSAGGVITDVSAANGRVFEPFGAAPAPGDALLLGFDVLPAASGETLNLHVWTATWRTDRDVRARLIEEEEDRVECIRPRSWPTSVECREHTGEEPVPEPHEPTWFLHYSARVAWEGWNGTTWYPLDVVTDETRALTLSGPIRLKAGTLAAGAAGAPDPARFWLRCRLVSGSYECPPRLAGIAVNTVLARHAAKVTGAELLGVSRGHAEEVYRVAGVIAAQGPGGRAQPLLPGTLRLEVGGDSWLEVPNWDRTGPLDRHVVTDPTDNSVRAGNGRVGRVMPADAKVEALEYRVGGGVLGNVLAKRLTHGLAGGTAGLLVRQPFDAIGGADAETLDRAHGRALALLARPARLITSSDFEALALDVPGVPVARAAAIVRHHPDLQCWTAPGVVTVVVVPRCGQPPAPGQDFLAAVARYLDRRRPLTTEVHVVGPHYVKVTIEATLHVAAAAPGLAAQAQTALDAFFDPLTGGPAGTGWPFGRGVLSSDVLVTLARLPGVLYVDGLSIEADSGPGRCENLDLCPTDLVASQPHRLTIVEG
jgi:predicted phage baseplate assembly protein